MRADMVKMVGKVNDTSKDRNAKPEHIGEVLKKRSGGRHTGQVQEQQRRRIMNPKKQENRMLGNLPTR